METKEQNLHRSSLTRVLERVLSWSIYRKPFRQNSRCFYKYFDFYFTSFTITYVLVHDVTMRVTVVTEEAAIVSPPSSALIIRYSSCSFHMRSDSSLRDSQPQTVTLTFFLSFAHLIRFSPDFLLPVWSTAQPIPSSAPVVLFCLRLWVCQHHKLSSNNIITSRDTGIPLLICLLILLLSGRRRVQKDLFPLFAARISAQFWSQQMDWNMLHFAECFCRVLTGFGWMQCGCGRWSIPDRWNHMMLCATCSKVYSISTACRSSSMCGPGAKEPHSQKVTACYCFGL